MSREPRRILCVHQGAELYGSDRVFLQSVRIVAEKFGASAVEIWLGENGPLQDECQRLGAKVAIRPRTVLRRAEITRLLGPGLPALAGEIRALARALTGFRFIYINTVVMVPYLLAARLAGVPGLVHVHEIPGRLERGLFSSLLALSGLPLVFNSEATRCAFCVPPGRPRFVVLNGTPAPKLNVPAPELTTGDPLRLLLIGRFNRWKGQLLLVDAIAALAATARARVRVRLVGSAFRGQERFVEAVARAIVGYGLSCEIEILPFAPDPDPHYDWCHVVVVPSTRPEPFGLVAIEAMARGRPVIAAGHGGLSEIVVDGETGRLFNPGSKQALTAAIQSYLDAPETVTTQGACGRQRFDEQFEERHYVRRLTPVIEALAGTRETVGATVGYPNCDKDNATPASVPV